MCLSQFIVRMVCLSLIMLSSQVLANQPDSAPSPSELTHANWIFSGVVTSEAGDDYGYFFQMQREENHFQATASIIDAQDNTVLILEKEASVIQQPQNLKWQVGRAFLFFNPITESWVFGLKPKNKKGFNFKVDMLSSNATTDQIKGLRKDLNLAVNQTGRVNGHIQLGKEKSEIFVTSNNAWYRKLWSSEKLLGTHPLLSLLCRFNDGSGFYSFNLKEEDAHEGAIAGLCDAKGNPSPLSQFIEIQEGQDTKPWRIKIPAPEMKFELSDTIKNSELLAGFVAEGAKSGFCILCKGHQAEHAIT